jgi:uroporphyrinogen decarboxylase
MSKRERIQAVLKGEAVDRIPVAFWRHWPGDDQNAESLATVAIEFQQQYDLDFIKVPVSSTYCVDDYGVKHAYRGSSMGDRDYMERVIKRPEDWDHIEPLDVHKGTYGIHLQALRIIMKRKNPDTPVLFTMFNPLAMALYLAGDETCLVHLRREPERVEHALKALAETSARFANAVIAEGCDGIFLSTRAASYEVLSKDEYNRFGRPGDMTVLAAAARGWFNVLHLHGQHPMFVSLSDYPVDAVNWHDRTAYPDLTEASRLFSGALMGGIEQYRILHLGTPENIIDQVQNAINKTNGRHLILTPGCTYPLGVPRSNLLALRQSVEKSRR